MYVANTAMALMGLINLIWMKEGTERVIKYHKKYFGGKTSTEETDEKKDIK